MTDIYWLAYMPFNDLKEIGRNFNSSKLSVVFFADNKCFARNFGRIKQNKAAQQPDLDLLPSCFNS